MFGIRINTMEKLVLICVVSMQFAVSHPSIHLILFYFVCDVYIVCFFFCLLSPWAPHTVHSLLCIQFEGIVLLFVPQPFSI